MIVKAMMRIVKNVPNIIGDDFDDDCSRKSRCVCLKFPR
jgi:hypothetical protein